MTGKAVLKLVSIILVPTVYVILLTTAFSDMSWLLRVFFLTGAIVLTYATIDYFRGISEDRSRADAEGRSAAKDEG